MLFGQFHIPGFCRVGITLLLLLGCDLALANTQPTVQDRFMSSVARGELGAIHMYLQQQPQLLDSHTRSGKTALQLAIENHHLTMVRELLKLGADPDLSSQGHLCPLHLAVIHRQLHALHLLLREGVTLEARDAGGSTALMYAVRLDNELMAKTLLRAGARVDGLEPGNWSPLMRAAVRGSQSMVTLLLHFGASRERINDQGLTASQIAEQKEFHELARLLRPDRE